MRNCVVNLLGFLLISQGASGQVIGEAGNEVDVEYQAQLLEWQEVIAATDAIENYWEYVILRVNGVEGLEAADRFSKADVFIDIQALTDTEPDVEFFKDEKLSRFVFGAQDDTDDPEWAEIGVVAYKQGSASQLAVILQDVEFIGSDEVLLETTLDLPMDKYDQWVDYSLSAEPYTLNLSVFRSITPIFSSQDQHDMGLTEVIFDNEDGSVASLVYKTNPGNTKAVLYFAGRADSFAHPHVLAMYEALGYDFYSLDPRYCGRTRRFMKDTQYGHWIEDFDIYTEEIDKALDFIRGTSDYSSILTHCHSTGALMALNYAMQLQEHHPDHPEPFQGYILNGPFLDWGRVGGFVNELLLENTGLTEWFWENPQQASGLSRFHARMWVLYRYNTEWRPIIQAHVNAGWAQAITAVQRKITSRDESDPITASPVLLINSLGDNTLSHTESEERMPHVASDYASILLEHNSHDVTLSLTKQLNDDALAKIVEWLTTKTEGGDAEAETKKGLLQKLLDFLFRRGN